MNLHARGPHDHRLFTWVATGIALFVAGAAGMTYAAGSRAVAHRIAAVDWPWLAASVAAVLAAFAAYYAAYRGLRRMKRGPHHGERGLLLAAAAGFGAFVPRGGTALDASAVRAAGSSAREGHVRALALGGFELAVLAMGTCAAALAVVVTGASEPPAGWTWPWLVGPVVGFALGGWLAERRRDALRDRPGWRGRLGVALDAAHLVVELLRRPRRYGATLAGMVLYWAADAFAVWAALAALGVRMPAGALLIGYATGYIVTRRTAPLGGAGLLTVLLAVTLWRCGAPLAAAVPAVVIHGFFSLWLPLPVAVASLEPLGALLQGRAPRASA